GGYPGQECGLENTRRLLTLNPGDILWRYENAPVPASAPGRRTTPRRCPASVTSAWPIHGAGCARARTGRGRSDSAQLAGTGEPAFRAGARHRPTSDAVCRREL